MNKVKGEVIGSVFKTTQYDQFKRLPGNRSIKPERINKIRNSINAIGMRINPIVVNEKLEVIDGQGRLETAKILKVPVYVVIDKDAGSNECKFLNIGQTNWTTRDWIEHYAELGNDNYKRLLKVIESDVSKKFGDSFVAALCSGKFGLTSKSLKDGMFVMSVDEQEILDRIEVMSQLDIDNRIHGTVDNIYFAVSFALQIEGVDKDRLINKINEKLDETKSIAKIELALKAVEDIYNDHLKNRIWIAHEYEKAMTDKYSWYAKKYGIDKE